MLKKIQTNITYRVPAWEYCNLVVPGTLTEPSKKLCRFCVTDGKGRLCALYNEALLVEQGTMPKKCNCCVRATAGFKSVVTDADEPTPSVDPKLIMKSTIATYEKVRKQLLRDGYPATIAESVAKEHVLGGA